MVLWQFQRMLWGRVKTFTERTGANTRVFTVEMYGDCASEIHIKNFTVDGNCLSHTRTAGRKADIPAGTQPCGAAGICLCRETGCGLWPGWLMAPSTSKTLNHADVFFRKTLRLHLLCHCCLLDSWGCLGRQERPFLSGTNSPHPYLSTRALLLFSANTCRVKCG